jgi:hypothetical protein
VSFEVEGNLYRKFDTEQKTDSFRAREFVLQIEGQYPQLIKFQLTQDRCDLIDAYDEGNQLKVHFDLRGREWNDKYFTNLNAWRVEAAEQGAAAAAPAQQSSGGGSSAGGPAPAPPMTEVPAGAGQPNIDFDDDIPF